MSLQRRSFDPSMNPFLRASNPYRIQQKFHTQASSQQKYKKDYFNKHIYNTTCNHCVKNVPFIEQMNTRSTFLKAQKQNLQKMSSTRFKNTKIGSNPFQKRRLMGQTLNTTNNSYSEYSGQDQGKLRNLLQNNPFKKYQQQKQSIDRNKQFDVEFHQINLIKLASNQKSEQQGIESTSRWISPFHNRQSSARFSIDSMNNNSNRMNSIENSPNKKSKFSPTVMDIASYRGNSSKKILNQIPINEKMVSCLINQINQSRKDLLEYSKHQKQSEKCISPFVSSNSQAKLPPKSPTKQFKSSNLENPQFIMIKGKKFFLNQVKLKY